LIKNQAAGLQNGVYVVTQVGSAGTPYILTRATDFDSVGTGVDQIDEGDFFLVTNGVANLNTAWVQQTAPPITIGTTAIVFQQFSAPITYTAGTGLSESPTYTFNIANTTVTAATYGSASQVPVFAVNAQGQLTSVTNTSIAIASAAVSGLAASATTDTTNAANITSGTLPSGRISGSYTSLTGTGALAAGSLATGFTAVSAPLGGTGQTSYAVGDLLYASTTTALSKLADVAVGNALISGGVSAAPSYGKIGLATHVSGTLPVANGGTGATDAAGIRTAAGATTVGGNVFTLTNPSAITFPRFNADNTVSALDAPSFRTAIGAGTSSTTGTVTSVSGTGTVSGITLTGTVTGSGNLTLGGTIGTLNQNTTGTAGGLSATLVATSGGTGQSSYAVGDLLYASTTTALSKLADVATGNALISGGVGVAPGYGKIGLTTHISGTLATGNGGTGSTATAYCALGSNVSGTLPVANGGTGNTTAQAEMNRVAAAVTSGQYLRGNGTNVVMSAIQAGDVPTLNQNTTGSSASCTGNAATATTATNQSGGTVSATTIFASTSISLAGNGSSNDPYGTMAVTEPANANNYSYYGLTRAGQIGAGFGITGTNGALGLGANAFCFGAASAGSAGVVNSPWIAFSGGAFVAAGTIAGSNITSGGNVTGSSASCTGNAATATTATNQSGGTVSATTGTFTGNITVSTSNATGGGIVLADDGDIVDLNDAYCSMRFSAGVRVFSANRGGSAVITLANTGAITASGNITANSDERLKKDWAALPPNFIEQLATVKSGTYTRIDSDKRQAGSSAQDWQKLLPETVMEGADDDKTLSLAYGNAALVSAVELAKRVVEQDERIAKLEALVAQLTKGSAP
jgi:hypothetical protein